MSLKLYLHNVLQGYRLENSNAEYLFCACEDDISLWSSVHTAKNRIYRLKDAGRTNYKLLTYPGAGHLFEPPYFPHCGMCYTKLFGKVTGV